MPRRQLLSLLLVTGTAALAACSSSSTLSLPAPHPADPRCAALVAALPTALGPSLRVRPTKPTSTSTRAWGSPAVTVVCGGTRPRIVDRDGLTIDGVDWSSPDEGHNPTVYRLKDAAEPYVVVTLPTSVEPVTALGPVVDAINAGRSPSAPRG